MAPFKNRLGEKFGRLLVIERLPNNKSINQAVWKCRCDCGTETSVRASNLHCGQTKSCGCLHMEIISKRPYEHAYNRLLHGAKRRHKKCDITYEEYLSFTTIKNCFYCGELIEWSPHVSNSRNQGYKLDRINNSIGYIKSNCCVACATCNNMKAKMNSEDFIKHCLKVIERNKL